MHDWLFNSSALCSHGSQDIDTHAQLIRLRIIDRRKRLAQSFTLTQSVGINEECHSGGICESYGIRIVDKFELMILVDKKRV